MEVTAHPQHVVHIKLNVSDASIGSTDPARVKGSSRGVELHKVRCRGAIDIAEIAADPYGGAVGGDGVDLRVDVCGERRVERTGNRIDLGDSVAKGAVDVCETAADVEVVPVGRDCDGVDDLGGIRNYWGKCGINLTSCDVDGSD